MTEMTYMITSKQIAQDLLRAGLRRSGVVLVHSSLSTLGQVPGGPETVIRGLLEALGTEGTLLFPALSYETVNPEHPVFDIAFSPSNIGAIPEHFRKRPGTIRSICPTHSVSGVGPLAADLLGGHHRDDTPCGPHSPYRKLPDVDGQILFLGCGMRPNTSMHAVEEVTRPPYLFGEMATYEVIDPDGNPSTQPCRRHDFRGFAQRYERIAPLMAEGELRVGRVLEAEVEIIEAAAMWKRAIEAYRSDPLFFVDRIDEA